MKQVFDDDDGSNINIDYYYNNSFRKTMLVAVLLLALRLQKEEEETEGIIIENEIVVQLAYGYVFLFLFKELLKTSLLYMEESFSVFVCGGQRERKPICGHMVFLFLCSTADIIWSDTRPGDFLHLINHLCVNRRTHSPQFLYPFRALHHIPPCLVSFWLQHWPLMLFPSCLPT